MKSYANIKLKEKISIEDLFELMSTTKFSYGMPELYGAGKSMKISFLSDEDSKIIISTTGKSILISEVNSSKTKFLNENFLISLNSGLSTVFSGTGNKKIEELTEVIRDLVA